MGTGARQKAIAGYPAEASRRNSKAGMEQAAQDAGHLYAGFDDDRDLVHGDRKMKWKYFCGACLIVGAALLKAGAPPFTVIAGIILAASWNFFRRHTSPARNGLNGGKGTITSTKRAVNP